MNEDTVEKALKYLAETDQSHANALALVKSYEKVLDIVKSEQFLKSSGNNEERMAKAKTSPEYREENEKRENAWADYQLLENKRERARITLDLYRTMSANQRKGNI